MDRKKVLLISYYLYPYYNFGGGRRFSGLIRFFKENRIEFDVITSACKSSKRNNILFFYDPLIKKEKIDRGKNHLRFLNPLPDSMIFWSFLVLKFLKSNYKKYEKIIITAPPFSLPLFLSFTFRKHSLKSFVLDVRDLYYDGTLRDYRIHPFKFIDYFFDKRIFLKFKKLTTNIEIFVDILKKRYNKKRVDLIYNSIDDDFDNVKKIDLGQRLNIVYTGKLDRYRFNKEFFEEYDKISGKVNANIYIIGEVEKNLKVYLSGLKNLNLLGTLSYNETKNYIYSSDIFLIMHPFELKAGNTIFSSKLIDAIMFQKKILYIGPESEVFRFVKKNNIGETVSKEDIEKLGYKINQIVKNEYKYDKHILAKFKKPFLNTYFTDNLF